MRVVAIFLVVLTSAPSHSAEWDRLDLRKSTYEKSPHGSLLYANFVINNPTELVFSDINVECIAYAPSGTALKTHRETLFFQFPPKKVTRLKRMVLGFTHQQANGVSCSIVGGKSDDRG